MTDEAVLKLMKKTMAEMLLENNKRLVPSIEQSIAKAVQESEERIMRKLTESSESLSKKIDDSQKDTINTLSALMHSGYDLHETRIQRIEDELQLPPIKQKH